MEEKNMNKLKRFFTKPMAIAASFALCLCLTGITAFAATGKIGGFFKDITRWDGAVIGSSYEQATDEVEVTVNNAEGELIVELTLLNADVVPYREFEMFGIDQYKIVDRKGTVVAENALATMSLIENGKVSIRIPLDNIASGEYTLIVSKLVGSSKADQPLLLSGIWKCDFTY